ncbi:hypothetical protein ACF1CY_000758 [Providencia rettgeri]
MKGLACKRCQKTVETLVGHPAPLKQDEYGIWLIEVTLACPHCGERYHVDVASSAFRTAAQ